MKRYTDFSELTTPMLNEFIKKVIVHEVRRNIVFFYTIAIISETMKIIS